MYAETREQNVNWGAQTTIWGDGQHWLSRSRRPWTHHHTCIVEWDCPAVLELQSKFLHSIQDSRNNWTVQLFRPFQKSGETVLHFPSCHVLDDESVLVTIWDIWGWVAHESKVLPFLNRSNEILTNFNSKKCNEFVLGSVGTVSRPSSVTRLFQIDFRNWFELSDELDEREEVTFALNIIHFVTRSMECQIPLCQEFDSSQ